MSYKSCNICKKNWKIIISYKNRIFVIKKIMLTIAKRFCYTNNWQEIHKPYSFENLLIYYKN